MGCTVQLYCTQHKLALASRPMPLEFAFWHPVSQSGTGAFRYRTGSGIADFVHFGTRLIRCRTVRHSGIDKKRTPRTSTLSTTDWDTTCEVTLLVGKGVPTEIDTPWTLWVPWTCTSTLLGSGTEYTHNLFTARGPSIFFSNFFILQY
jgi:hypothetical protein